MIGISFLTCGESLRALMSSRMFVSVVPAEDAQSVCVRCWDDVTSE